MKKTGILIISIFWIGILLGQTQKERLDSLFTTLHNQKAFNGNVLIADKGKIIFQKSYGLANEDTKKALNKSCVFELASVSKQFTAMGIVLLQKQGKLNYDDAISLYIPELEVYNTISIRQLLNHTGGLPDYMSFFARNWDRSKFVANQDIVNEFVRLKPEINFPAGEKYEYSNTGYALLALIIERVAKQSFGNYLHENIFKPLNMKNTLVYRSRYQPQEVKNYAYGYVNDSLGNKVLLDSFGKDYYTYFMDGIVGDGMVNSTAEDLLKWDRALYTNKLINEVDKKEIFGYSESNNGEKVAYGFGWELENNKKYGQIVNHTGSWAGYITLLERHLDNDKTIILLQNNASGSTKIPNIKVRKILYNEP